MYIIINMDDEIYRPCTYPGVMKDRYFISNYGNIKNNDGRIAKITSTYNRYKRAHLRTDDGGHGYFSIHRLVAWEYCEGYDPSTKKVIVNHLDGDRYHNYYENLEWCTQSENAQHKYDHLGYVHPGGPVYYGEDSPRAKYKEAMVREICSLLSDGCTVVDIMRYFGYCRQKDNKPLYSLIYDISRRRVWQHVSSEYNFQI